MMNDNFYWYIASYPRSGSTWCRAFINELLNYTEGLDSSIDLNEKINSESLNLNTGPVVSSRCWFDEQLGFDSSDLFQDEIDNFRKIISQDLPIYYECGNFYKVHDALFLNSNDRNPIIPIKNCKGIIYLIRNPLDVCISLTNFYSWSILESMNFLINERASVSNHENKISPQLRQYLGSWDYHVQSWTKHSLLPILVMRYEDLILNPFSNFQKIANFINLPCNEKTLRKIIKNVEFNSLQKRELKYGFNERPRSCKSFFYKGKIKQWEGLIENHDKIILVNKFKDTMMKWKYI